MPIPLARRLAAGCATLLLFAGSASACPSCAAGTSTEWFRYTTVLLSLVPLAAIGAVIWWIRRQVIAGGGSPGE